MSYQILILRRAQKELAGLTKSDYERVRDEVFSLADNPRPAGCKKLVGREGWRVRVGNYRIIYELDDAGQRVTVLHIGHRRDVYD
jgi:mRNA interferase RelE/StbE